MGDFQHLRSVRKVTGLPLLCKDFIIDPYQIYQARYNGADAVLLITAILEPDELKKLLRTARGLSMAALVEVHTEEEIQRTLKADPDIMGINNRDLQTFKTDIETTLRLLPSIPEDKVVVTESGYHTRKDLERLRGSRVNAFLIGEALMKEKDIGKKLRELLLSNNRIEDA